MKDFLFSKHVKSFYSKFWSRIQKKKKEKENRPKYCGPQKKMSKKIDPNIFYVVWISK